MLSEKLGLCGSELPMMMPISRHQAWRVKELFESMLGEVHEQTYTGMKCSEHLCINLFFLFFSLGACKLLILSGEAM